MRWVRQAARRLSRQSEWSTLSGEDRRQLSADIGVSDAELNAVVRDGSNSRELMSLLARPALRHLPHSLGVRSEEHTSELQSLMRISYAVFCLKKKNKNQ